MAEEEPKPHCSFCGLLAEQVKTLIAGPTYIWICDDCVDFCSDIIRLSRDKPEKPEKPEKPA